MAKVVQVYCNRRYMPEDEARIGLFDRGFLFADAVYEVTAVIGGRLIDNNFHLSRLQRSLAEMEIPMPMTLPEIETIQIELISRNGLTEGTVYLQISRGEAKRNFLFADDLEPTMVTFTSARKLVGTKPQTEGASATAFIVTHDRRVVTRANSQTILPGCTRRAVERLCEDSGIVFEEDAFSPAEAFSAAGAFLTSASSLVTPVIHIATIRSETADLVH